MTNFIQNIVAPILFNEEEEQPKRNVINFSKDFILIPSFFKVNPETYGPGVNLYLQGWATQQFLTKDTGFSTIGLTLDPNLFSGQKVVSQSFGNIDFVSEKVGQEFDEFVVNFFNSPQKLAVPIPPGRSQTKVDILASFGSFGAGQYEYILHCSRSGATISYFEPEQIGYFEDGYDQFWPATSPTSGTFEGLEDFRLLDDSPKISGSFIIFEWVVDSDEPFGGVFGAKDITVVATWKNDRFDG